MLEQRMLRLLQKLSLQELENALLHLYQESPSQILASTPLLKGKSLQRLSEEEWILLAILLKDLLQEKSEAPLH